MDEKPGGLQPMGSQRVGHDWVTNTFTFILSINIAESFWVSKSLQMVSAAMKLNDTCSLEKSYGQPRQHIKKQRYYFANKGPSSQSYGFSNSHVWMWKLDYKESWVPKNWSFWTVVLEKTLESPLDCKEIEPVHPQGNQSWIFIGRPDAEAEVPILWPPDAKNWLIWKDSLKVWRQEEKGTTEDEMVGWHHWLNGHEFEQALGVDDGQGSLTCCSLWVAKSRTLLSNWTETTYLTSSLFPMCY